MVKIGVSHIKWRMSCTLQEHVTLLALLYVPAPFSQTALPPRHPALISRDASRSPPPPSPPVLSWSQVANWFPSVGRKELPSHSIAAALCPEISPYRFIEFFSVSLLPLPISCLQEGFGDLVPPCDRSAEGLR